MMRLDDIEKFIYMLKRGILPSSADSDGNTAIHYAVRLDRLDCLRLMLGESVEGSDPTAFLNMTTRSTLSSHSLLTNRRPLVKTWVKDAVGCLERSSFNPGHTPLHEAAVTGNEEIFELILKTLKHQRHQSGGEAHKSVKTILEFSDSDNMTPLLLAAKNGHD